MAVWLASPEARFLRDKFVCCNWDVDELKENAKENENSPIFTIGFEALRLLNTRDFWRCRCLANYEAGRNWRIFLSPKNNLLTGHTSSGQGLENGIIKERLEVLTDSTNPTYRLIAIVLNKGKKIK